MWGREEWGLGTHKSPRGSGGVHAKAYGRGKGKMLHKVINLTKVLRIIKSSKIRRERGSGVVQASLRVTFHSTG